MQKAYNFKLLPPRTHLGQVSLVRPREAASVEQNAVSDQSKQSLGKCADTEQFPSKMVHLPTKASRADAVMKKVAVTPIEKEVTSLRSSQLYARLLDEAEKIKLWKSQMDSEISHKDKKLQDNRRTIETQRKAIQELQFANEGLSIKLEDQMNENDDLRNRNNATRNLCNILKETFDRTAEKMNIYEFEREETQVLFMQNNENIQGMMVAFENLQRLAEADQQDALKLRECLKDLEDEKVKCESDCLSKKREIYTLQGKLEEKECDLKMLSLKLKDADQSSRQLQDSAANQQKMLECVTLDRDMLEEKLRMTEQLKNEIEKNQIASVDELEQTKMNCAKVLQEKEIKIKELTNTADQQSKQLEELQLAMSSLQSSLTSEVQRTHGFETNIGSLQNELNFYKSELATIREETEDLCKETQTLRDKLVEKENLMSSINEKLDACEAEKLQTNGELEEKRCELNQLKEKMEKSTTENESMVEALKTTQSQLEESQQATALKQMKLKETQDQLLGALERCNEASDQVERLEREMKQQKGIYEDLMLKYNELQKLKDSLQQEVSVKAQRGNVEIETLRQEKQQLQEQMDSLSDEIGGQAVENKNVKEQLRKNDKISKREILNKDKQIKALESKLTNLKTKLETKTKAHSDCLDEITKIKDKSENASKNHQEELQRLLSEIEDKSASEAQLHLEIQRLTNEALKSKDDTELKCQKKISDIVTLMEKHKHEYDKTVEKKDAEVSESRMKVAEINASKALLDLDLSNLKEENVELRQELEKMKTEMAALKTPVSSLRNKTPLQKSQIKAREKNKSSKPPEQDSAIKDVFALFDDAENEPFTPVRAVNKVQRSPLRGLKASTYKYPHVKTFRIRTPPTPDPKEPWKSSILELDPTSESSDSTGIMSFSPRPVKPKKPMQPKETERQGLKKELSSFDLKSPGTEVKQACIKRMRDAGWTVFSSDKTKKKKSNLSEKLFA